MNKAIGSQAQGLPIGQLSSKVHGDPPWCVLLSILPRLLDKAKLETAAVSLPQPPGKVGYCMESPQHSLDLGKEPEPYQALSELVSSCLWVERLELLTQPPSQPLSHHIALDQLG